MYCILEEVPYIFLPDLFSTKLASSSCVMLGVKSFGILFNVLSAFSTFKVLPNFPGPSK